MSGDVEPIYVAARAALLDAFVALAEHRTSIILVGAQAIYIHTGEADLAIAPFTADGDLALDPRELANRPALEAAMEAKRFTLKKDQVGILGGAGSRGARLEGHDYKAARKVRGIEGCLDRTFEIEVAGPAALLVSKCHKLAERLAEGRRARVKPKDAYDVLRILRAVGRDVLVAGCDAMASHDVSRETANSGLTHLRDLFGRSRLPGADLAAQAADGLEDETTVRESCAALTSDLIARLDSRDAGS